MCKTDEKKIFHVHWLFLIVLFSGLVLDVLSCPSIGTYWLNVTGFALPPGSSSMVTFTL